MWFTYFSLLAIQSSTLLDYAVAMPLTIRREEASRHNAESRAPDENEQTPQDENAEILEPKFELQSQPHQKETFADSLIAVLPQPSMLLQSSHALWQRCVNDWQREPFLWLAAMSTGSLVALCLFGCIGFGLKQAMTWSDKVGAQNIRRSIRQSLSGS
mmetsp:Transcript_50873/g.80670  ORF Transcript_50873/g.80670 Transcript_50873/m.80670 type:complete len:158 (-) Transcript_50873:62-535(-)